MLVGLSCHRVRGRCGAQENLLQKLGVSRGKSQSSAKHSGLVPAAHMRRIKAVAPQLLDINDCLVCAWKLHDKLLNRWQYSAMVATTAGATVTECEFGCIAWYRAAKGKSVKRDFTVCASVFPRR
jgi:hypothetical protein